MKIEHIILHTLAIEKRQYNQSLFSVFVLIDCLKNITHPTKRIPFY